MSGEESRATHTLFGLVFLCKPPTREMESILFQPTSTDRNLASERSRVAALRLGSEFRSRHGAGVGALQKGGALGRLGDRRGGHGPI